MRFIVKYAFLPVVLLTIGCGGGTGTGGRSLRKGGGVESVSHASFGRVGGRTIPDATRDAKSALPARAAQRAQTRPRDSPFTRAAPTRCATRSGSGSWAFLSVARISSSARLRPVPAQAR